MALVNAVRVMPKSAVPGVTGRSGPWGYKNIDGGLFGEMILVNGRAMVNVANVEAYLGRPISDDEIKRAHAAYNAAAYRRQHKDKPSPAPRPAKVKVKAAAKSNPTIIIIEHRGARAETRAERRQRIMTQYDPQSHLGVKNGL